MKNLLLFFLLIFTAPAFGQMEVTLPMPDSAVYTVEAYLPGSFREINLVLTVRPDSLLITENGNWLYGDSRRAHSEMEAVFLYQGWAKHLFPDGN